MLFQFANGSMVQFQLLCTQKKENPLFILQEIGFKYNSLIVSRFELSLYKVIKYSRMKRDSIKIIYADNCVSNLFAK